MRRGGVAIGPSVGLLLGLALGCAQPVWNLEALEAGHPRLAAIGSHRLGETTPYLLPAAGELTLFLCRWPDGASIPVSLPRTASPEERRRIESALRAWEGAGLGIRFEERGGAAGGAREDDGIEIRFAPEVPEGEATPRAARTGADCAVDPRAVAERSFSLALPARLVFASVELMRFGRNVLGQGVPHTQEELLGSALHELGHALGFQGHSVRDDTIMSRSVDVARRAGRRVLAGERFQAPTLRALYALPTGVVVRRVRLSLPRTDPFDRLASLAGQRGLAGPFVRVGDRAARITWRLPSGGLYRLFVLGLPGVLRDPSALEVVPTGEAAALLAREVR